MESFNNFNFCCYFLGFLLKILSSKKLCYVIILVIIDIDISTNQTSWFHKISKQSSFSISKISFKYKNIKNMYLQKRETH